MKDVIGFTRAGNGSGHKLLRLGINQGVAIQPVRQGVLILPT